MGSFDASQGGDRATGQLTTRPTLLERLKGRNEQAWIEFLALYAPLVDRLGRLRGLSAEARQSLVQDFSFRALQALPTFEYRPDRGRFRNWVLTVALNELRQTQRAQAARDRALDGYQPTGETGPSSADETWWKDAEHRRALELALRRLRKRVRPEKFRAFLLVAREGRPVAEVAAACGLRNGQVSLIKFRLLKQLRAIAREIVGEWDEP